MQRLYTNGVVSLLFLLSLPSFQSQAQTPTNPLAPGYYIVVAAYRLHQDSYAQSYVNRISKDGVTAKYGADIGRKYLYVYLDYYTDFDESIREMLAARKKAGFEQAWVRIMKDELNTSVNVLTQNEEAKPKPATSSTPQPVVEPEAAQTNVETTTGIVEEEVETVEEPVVEPEKVKEEAKVEDEPITEPKPVAESSVFLSLYNATNSEQIDGEVEVVDPDRARLITKVKGNEYINLPDPKSKSGKLTLLANVFGYRPVQHEIHYGQIPSDSLGHFVEWAGNHYIIKFDLVRYHKGDIQTLYNVYFFNDAAIMLPESKYQLNNLLDMLKENPNYRIMLHGHTNGNARGRLITMGPSKSFFSLADDVKDGTGSAKELSKQRAHVIREWLLSEGITEDRVEIKAWGGGRMLHDKNSANARKNVRVDVEILQE